GQLVNVSDISVWARNGRTGVLTGPVTTNPQGFFETQSLPPGSYQICVSGSGYLSACDPSTVNVGTSLAVLNHTVAITPAPNAVWGTSRPQDWTPCFWFKPPFGGAVTAKVTLIDAGNNVLAGPVNSNSLGQYVLPVSAVGSYSVHATYEGASGSASV